MIIRLLDVVSEQEVVALTGSEPAERLARCIMQHEPLAVRLQLALHVAKTGFDGLSKFTMARLTKADNHISLHTKQPTLTTTFVSAASARLINRT